MYYAKRMTDYERFVSDEKNGYSNLLIFCGKEPYLSAWATDRIIKQNIQGSARLMNLTELDEFSYSFSELKQSMESLPILGGRRVTVINISDAAFLKSDNDNILGLLENYKDDKNYNILILNFLSTDKVNISVKMKKLFTIYEFKKLKDEDLFSFIHKQLKKKKVFIDDKSIRHLINVSGYLERESDYDLRKLTSDIDKIISYLNQMEVTDSDDIKAAIDGVVLGYQESYVFSLIDNIFAKNTSKSIKIFNNIYPLEKDLGRLISLIISSFEIALSIKQLEKDGVNISEAVKILGVNKFRGETIRKNTVKLSESEIKTTLMKAYKIEEFQRKGLFDPKTSIEYFLGTI